VTGEAERSARWRVPRVAVPSVATAGVVAGAVGIGFTFGLPLALLFVAGSVLVGIVFLLWASMQSATGDAPLTLEEAIGLGLSSAEEEQKRAVLRALKDLDYERSVGKISEEDYRELSERYRREGKTLLRAFEAELAPARKTAERRLAKRLAAEGLGATPEAAAAPAALPKAAEEPAEKSAPTPQGAGPHACAACGTQNDADARFCKRCGKDLATVGQSAPAAPAKPEEAS
jgi:hypothetical protein